MGHRTLGGRTSHWQRARLDHVKDGLEKWAGRDQLENDDEKWGW